MTSINDDLTSELNTLQTDVESAYGSN